MDNLKRIRKLLITFGITPNIKGYNYLVFAVNYALEAYKQDAAKSIEFIKLYKLIGATFNDTYTKVERAMRWAITRAFGEPTEPLKSVFTFVNENTEHPSISCFVCTVAQYLYYEE